ncbi:hypothetical protein ACQJBY_036082 [Aegilops geniculata]
MEARKSAPGQPWSDGETMHLIDVYEDRWTKLRRGQLKAHQWEDVAGEVTHRCGGQRKTGTQCRHKLEKLRKRYRTEAARPVTSLWPFFRRMERLERGPVPVSTNSFPASPPASDDDQDHDLDQDEEEEDEEEQEQEEEEDHDQEDQEEEEEQLLVARSSGSHTRSINGLVRDAGGFRGHQQQQRRLPSPPAVTLSTAPPRKRVSYEAAMFQSKAAAADRVKAEEAPAMDQSSVAGVLRDIGEGIKRLERRRMEVQWEIERGWKETEARSNQMLQDAQRQLQDTLAALPPPGKKARRDHGSSADGM